MGLFDKIGEVRAAGAGGVYFEPGIYAVEVLAIKQGRTREGRPFFVAEFKILESDNPDRKVGSSVSWMVMMDKYLETALSNIKGLVCALMEIDESEVDAAGIEALTSADNPALGLRVRAEAVMIKTKAKEDFTKVIYRPYNQAESAAA